MKKIAITILLFLPLLLYGQGMNVMHTSNKTRVVVSEGGGSYTSQYQAVLDAMTTDPTGDTLTWQNELVDSLVNMGYWETRDIIYIPATTNNGAGEALINWKSPGTYNLTNISDAVWTKNTGFQGDGTADYLNTNFNAGDGGSYNFTQNSARVSIYLMVDQQEDSRFVFGARVLSTTEFHFIPRTTSNQMSGESNGGVFSVSNSRGLSDGYWSVNRSGANLTDWYQNGTTEVLWTDADASNGVPNAEMYILNRSGSGGFSTNQFGYFDMGASVSPSIESRANAVIETYMDRMGVGKQ